MDGGFRTTYYKDDDIGLRIYQEKVQNGVPKDEVKNYNTYAKMYIDQGVDPEEANVLAHFSVLVETGLEKAEINEDPWLDSEDMYEKYDMIFINFYKINNEGEITELHLHHSDKVLLTIIPKILASLKHLEVLKFPNNLIKEIPEWIVKLQFLRVLDVNNTDIGPNPHIPDSIKPFIESLESFNKLSGRDILKYFLKPRNITKSTYSHYNVQYDILIVEDDLPTMRLLINFFESKGIPCTALVNGTDALHELKYNTPKLILTDITHPGPSGYELCKKIKSNQKLKNIPVFFCTSRLGSEIEKHLVETKADGYILKPFNFSDFDIILDFLKT